MSQDKLDKEFSSYDSFYNTKTSLKQNETNTTILNGNNQATSFDSVNKEDLNNNANNTIEVSEDRTKTNEAKDGVTSDMSRLENASTPLENDVINSADTELSKDVKQLSKNSMDAHIDVPEPSATGKASTESDKNINEKTSGESVNESGKEAIVSMDTNRVDNEFREANEISINNTGENKETGRSNTEVNNASKPPTPETANLIPQNTMNSDQEHVRSTTPYDKNKTEDTREKYQTSHPSQVIKENKNDNGDMQTNATESTRPEHGQTQRSDPPDNVYQQQTQCNGKPETHDPIYRVAEENKLSNSDDKVLNVDDDKVNSHLKEPDNEVKVSTPHGLQDSLKTRSKSPDMEKQKEDNSKSRQDITRNDEILGANQTTGSNIKSNRDNIASPEKKEVSDEQLKTSNSEIFKPDKNIDTRTKTDSSEYSSKVKPESGKPHTTSTNSQQQLKDDPKQTTNEDNNVNENRHVEQRSTENSNHAIEVRNDTKKDTVKFGETAKTIEMKPDIHNKEASANKTTDTKSGKNTTVGANEEAMSNSKANDANPFFTGRLPTLTPFEPTELETVKNEDDHLQYPNETSDGIIKHSKEESQKEPLTEEGNRQQFQHSPIITVKDETTFNDVSRPMAPTPSRRTKVLSKDVTQSDIITEENRHGTPTPSRNIKELNDPTQQHSVEREKPITPREISKYQPTDSTDQSPSKANQNPGVTHEISHQKQKSEIANMTAGDIASVSSKVAKTTHINDRQSHFDNLPHMQNITKYVKENNKEETSRGNSPVDVSWKKTTTEVVHKRPLQGKTLMPDPSGKQTHGENKSKNNKQYTDDKHIQNQSREYISNASAPHRQYEKQQTKDTDEGKTMTTTRHSVQSTGDSSVRPHKDAQWIRRSMSDNELKEMIATAKIAIGQDPPPSEVQTEDNSGQTSITVIGETVAKNKRLDRRRPYESAREHGRRNNDTVENIPLICSSCMQPDTNVHDSGFCQECMTYLCNTCIVLHTMEPATEWHEILACYCKNELKIKKYIKATAYCSDCGVFYCSRCAMEHAGFRQFRRHKIIQSHFVSKPIRRKLVPGQFLEEICPEDGTLDSSPTSSKDTKKEKKTQKQRKKIMTDFKRYNPYRLSYNNVVPSLYPGPKTNISASYLSNPKWPYSSIPALPYLVQPKPMRERLLDAPYISQHKAHSQATADARVVKMKRMKNIYGVPEDAQTYQLKGGHSTAPSMKPSEHGSLPDIRNTKSLTVSRQSHIRTGHTKKVPKWSEFIADHCLSIPFPSGEQTVAIQSMDILLNGKLIVHDGKNNNVKLYSKNYVCKAALQFRSPIVDICASNLCPTDLYAATAKHVYEISSVKGLELKRMIKVEGKKIAGLACWKFGLLVVSKKTSITWELRLMDYRGILKSKLEILNPQTCEIASSALYHVTTTRAGKYLTITDTQNACIITVDVLTRKMVYETSLEDGFQPTYLSSDGKHNVFVSCVNRVVQLSKQGDVLGVVIEKPESVERFGCIVYNKLRDKLYIQTADDMISVYRLSH